ncbi:MAG: hypothetical protein O2871_00760 [bacterium]|nr:hypothetical protein [bacterium]
MSDIKVLTVEQLAEFLRKLINGEVLSPEHIEQVLFSISVANSEIDADLLKALKAQEQSES